MSKVIGILIGSVGIILAISLILALPTMVLWNCLMPVIFKLPSITFWQALGLNVLCSVLFKSSSSD